MHSTMTLKSDRADVVRAFNDYIEAFNSGDQAKLDACLLLPLTHIGNGGARTLHPYPVNIAEMRERRGWHPTECVELDVIAVSVTKVHVVMRNARRVRSDGSLIEEVSAYFAFTNTPEDWKIYAVSDLVIPA